MRKLGNGIMSIVYIVLQIFWAPMTTPPSQKLRHGILDTPDEEQKKFFVRIWEEKKRTDLQRISITVR